MDSDNSRIDEVIRMLDSLTESEVSRIKIKTDENMDASEVKKEYHHGRCDVGSPWARGASFDVLDC